MKIANIKIKLNLSTLIIVVLVGFYATSFYASIVQNAPLLELLIVGLINGIIILLSILTHELSHSIVAQKFGLGVSEIELYLFGGVSKIEEEPKTPKSELLIAIVGPLSSLLIGMFLLILSFLPITLPTILSVTLFYSGISNVGLGIFNLLPAFPIDGGRLLRAFLWKRRDNLLSATKSASKVGVAFGYGLMIYGVFQIFTFGFFNGLWLILIGSFLRNTARQSYNQTLNEVALSNISVKELLSFPIQIPFDMILSDAIREYFLTYKRDYFPVVQGQKIVGIIHIADVRRIPIHQRTNYIIGYVMRKISEFPYIDSNQSGKEAIKKLNQLSGQTPIIIVREVDNNELLGFIGKEELASSLKYWTLHTQDYN
ncbi:MAG: M50 family metallopeptidase [Candidatus Hodarchaeota archaeon]